MHVRYATSLLAALAGGFVVVASQAFAAGTTAWIAFAFGIGFLLLTAVTTGFGLRKIADLGLDALTAVLAIWTIVASLVFSGGAVTWLSFAEGLGFVALATAGLTLSYGRLALTHTRHAEQVTEEATEASRPTPIAA